MVRCAGPAGAFASRAAVWSGARWRRLSGGPSLLLASTTCRLFLSVGYSWDPDLRSVCPVDQAPEQDVFSDRDPDPLHLVLTG